MPGELVVISPELPGEGGVGDYTQRVVEQWPDVTLRLVDGDAGAIAELAPDANVLLQYSAYGFSRVGYPRALLRALLEWKRSARGRLVVMFHEIWTFWPVVNKNYPLQWLHRRDLANLLCAADAVFTSTASQAEHLRAASTRTDVAVLPVGSNIRVTASLNEARQPGLAVLFGLQGSRLATLKKMQSDLASLARDGVVTKIVTIGSGNTADIERAESEMLDSFQLRERFELRGTLPENEVSRLLARATFAISAQDESSVTKSGTFMAYAAHALNIISPHAGSARGEPLCWATRPDELGAGLSAAALADRAEKLGAWHERTCSWPRIAEEFARALRLPVAEPVSASPKS